MKKRRRGSLLCLASAGFALGSAALAWACVPASYLWMEPASGQSGQSVAIHGQQFEGGSVEVRWGSETGPLLATAPTANFTVTVEIPNAAAGVYIVLAITRRPDGSIREWARTPFEVTGSSSQVPASSSEGAGSSPPVAWSDGGYGQRPPDAEAGPSPASADLAGGAAPPSGAGGRFSPGFGGVPVSPSGGRAMSQPVRKGQRRRCRQACRKCGRARARNRARVRRACRRRAASRRAYRNGGGGVARRRASVNRVRSAPTTQQAQR